jgi:hypothetical protein
MRMKFAGWRAAAVAVAAITSCSAQAADPVADSRAAEFRLSDDVPAVTFAERVSSLRASILNALLQGGHLLSLEAKQARFGAFAPKEVQSFDSNNDLFLSSAEAGHRDALRLLIAEQQVRVSLRNDLHVACELSQYQAAQQEPEPALKLAVQFRFK